MLRSARQAQRDVLKDLRLVQVLALMALAVPGCSMPVGTPDPAELNWPVHRPMVTADVVHVEILYLHEVDGVDEPIREAIDRLGRHLAGEVRVVEHDRSPRHLDLPADEVPSEAQIVQAYEQVRRYSLPSDVLIVIVRDWEEASETTAGQHRMSIDGSQTVLLRAAYLDAGADRSRVVSRNDAWRLVTQHELAHALGVPADRNRQWAARHCVHPDCLLYPRFDYGSLQARLLRRQPADDLCQACAEELRMVRRATGVVPRKAYADYDLLAYLDDMVALNPDHANAYLHRLIVRGHVGDHVGELADLERALQLAPEEPAILERLAWRLATLPDDELRDGERAVNLARRGCEMTDWTRPSMIGALAAAHAEVGEFEKAAVLQKRLIEHPKASNRELLRQRLRADQASQPWRHPQHPQAGDE